MKKSLVVTLMLVFVLGIAGTALAANPFTDVPANHWAYASVSKLAQAGIIDGYGDGTFVGQRNMTRYEMAQIIAKAMARSDKADASMNAQIEKLAAEFSNELNGMGVRTARLEKNADNVKVTGEIRFANWSYDKKIGGDNSSELRSRIWLTGQINNRWTYGGMIEQNDLLNTNSNNDNTTNLLRAWVDGKIGDVDVTAGRFNYTPVYGVVLDTDGDGAKIGYSKNGFTLEAFAIRSANTNVWFDPYSVNPGMDYKTQTYGAVLGYDFNDKLNMQAAYYKMTSPGPNFESGDIAEVALKYGFSDMFSVWAEYIYGKTDEVPDLSKNGWAARMDYGKIDADKPGSWGLRAAYYDVPAAGSLATTLDMDLSPLGDGFKGYQLGATVVMAKNIDLNFDYYDMKTKEDTSVKDKLFFTYMQFYF